MQSKTSRTLVFIAVLLICGYVLYPSVEWYYLTDKATREKFDLTNPELAQKDQELTDIYVQLRQMIPNKKQRLKDKDEKEYIFNINPSQEKRYKEKYLLTTDDTIIHRIFGDQTKEMKPKFLTLVKKANQIKEDIRLAESFKKKRNSIVKMGLDLDGGTHLTFAVDKEDLIRRLRKNYASSGIKDTNTIEEIISDGKIPDKNKITVDEKLLKEYYKDQSSSEPINNLKQRRIDDYIKDIEDKLTKSSDDASKLIRTRIDKFGVSEPTISKGLGDTIFVELPRLNKKDVETTIKTITEAGHLNFHLVHEEWMDRIPSKYLVGSGRGSGYVNKTYVKYDPSKNAPPVLREQAIEDFKEAGIQLSEDIKGANLYPYVETDRRGFPQILGYEILYNKISIEGERLTSAHSGFDNKTNQPLVYFNLDNDGGVKMAKISGDNLHKRMAIVLDGNVRSDPRFQSVIHSSGQITLGRSSEDEVKKLVVILQAGALPAKLLFRNAITIGPKLGKENIQKGIFSVIVGLAVITIFMLIYYKLSGIIAVMGLVFNVYVLVAILSAFGFTLTLPGIAGIALTIGMAVDANVIIFERMREEIREGKSHHAVVDIGYKKAFSAIFDSNITTIIAAFVLAQIGTGVIKGFGFTLMWGIISSMFTALFVTHLIFDFLKDTFKLKKVYV